MTRWRSSRSARARTPWRRSRSRSSRSRRSSRSAPAASAERPTRFRSRCPPAAPARLRSAGWSSSRATGARSRWRSGSRTSCWTRSPSRAARTSARTTSSAWRRPTRPSPTTAGNRARGLPRTPVVRLVHDAFGHVTLARRGDALITDSHLGPAFPRPPLHVHPGQSERFEVHAGRLRLTVGSEQLVLGEGDAVTVPAGTPHAFAVQGPEHVRLRAIFHPAGQLESFFVGLHRLVERGHIDAKGRPRSRAVAAFALAHLDEFRLARAPARLQRAALRALSAGGRAG